MTSRRTTRRRPARTLALLALAPALALLTACSGVSSGSSAEDRSSSDSSGSTSASAGDGSVAGTSDALRARDVVASDAPVSERSVVSTGSVSVRSRDVSRVRDDVIALAHDLGGFLADEDTSTDTHGRARAARLQLRVPSARFGTAMSGIEDLGRLVRAQRSTKDVTTAVIDVGERVRAQRIGLRRLEALLSRAARLSEVLAVERQITERRADLDSLRSQQAYLRNHTSLATITVRVTRTAAPVSRRTRSGFGYGLEQGWHGLVRVTVGAATALGALLPFAVVLLVVGGPAVVLTRRLRRMRPHSPS